MQQLAAVRMLLRQPRRLHTVITLKLLSQRWLRPLLFATVDWRDHRRTGNGRFAQVPPAVLRYRVHGDLSLCSFLHSGEQTVADIRHALTRVGMNLDADLRILDFGCGCGRTLLWLSNEAKSADIHAADVDGEAIAWCRRAMKRITFVVNAPLPPLPYSAHTFDLIYAISVFTHLHETNQFRWLDELRRVVKPEGYVLISVHGSYYWNALTQQAVEEIKASGFLVARNPKFMDGIFPDWYQTTFHSPEYITTRYREYFDIVAYIPSGLDSCQDAVLLRRKP